MALEERDLIMLDDGFAIEVQDDIALDEDTLHEFAEELRQKYPDAGGMFVAYDAAENAGYAGEITCIPMAKEHLLDYFEKLGDPPSKTV